MASDLLTFSIDLDYINVESIQRYVFFLQHLIDKEIEKENLKPISKRRPFAKIHEILEETKVEPEVENTSLDGSEDRDLSKMTKMQISGLCKAKDIKFTKKTTKDELIKLLDV
jgi:galactitol-specific phosphotransferase system IIB component